MAAPVHTAVFGQHRLGGAVAHRPAHKRRRNRFDKARRLHRHEQNLLLLRPARGHIYSVGRAQLHVHNRHGICGAQGGLQDARGHLCPPHIPARKLLRQPSGGRHNLRPVLRYRHGWRIARQRRRARHKQRGHDCRLVYHDAYNLAHTRACLCRHNPHFGAHHPLYSQEGAAPLPQAQRKAWRAQRLCRGDDRRPKDHQGLRLRGGNNR